MEDINKRLDSIEKSIVNITTILNKISGETNRMDSHVSFVENVYETIKTPFHSIMNRVHFFSKYSSISSNNNNENGKSSLFPL